MRRIIKNNKNTITLVILAIFITFTPLILSACNNKEVDQVRNCLGDECKFDKNINANIVEDYVHYRGDIIEKIVLKDTVVCGTDIKEITLCPPYYNLVVIFMKDKKSTIMASLDNVQIYFNCEICY